MRIDAKDFQRYIRHGMLAEAEQWLADAEQIESFHRGVHGTTLFRVRLFDECMKSAEWEMARRVAQEIKDDTTKEKCLRQIDDQERAYAAR